MARVVHDLVMGRGILDWAKSRFGWGLYISLIYFKAIVFKDKIQLNITPATCIPARDSIRKYS